MRFIMRIPIFSSRSLRSLMRFVLLSRRARAGPDKIVIALVGHNGRITPARRARPALVERRKGIHRDAQSRSRCRTCAIIFRHLLPSELPAAALVLRDSPGRRGGSRSKPRFPSWGTRPAEQHSLRSAC